MTATTEKSYRTVPMAHPEAMISAARYLDNEWGGSLRLGFAGIWEDSYQRTWYVFQCRSGDGGRWLIRADAYGNVGCFDPSLEVEVSRMLDVEVSNDTDRQEASA